MIAAGGEQWGGQDTTGGRLLFDVLRRGADPVIREMSVVLWLLFGCGCWFAVSRSRPPVPAAAAMMVSGVAWLRVDQPREGRILWTLTPTHGVTEADLLVPLVICGAATVRYLRELLGSRGGGSGRPGRAEQ